MGPVEWTRLEGGQVEAVVAMFVNRERPTSVRITPSKGDGGVDILDRRAGPDGTDVVYQVKRYTDKLTAKQKLDIKDSVERLATDERWAGLSVTEWRLVTPWDPSPEAETWLQGLGSSDLRKIWHGLTWVDQQAAKYDDVIDYYLHGGRALVEKAHAEVMAILSTEKMDDGLTVPEVALRLDRALEALDHDPYYRYELRFGEGPPPPPPREGERPGLVMHCLTADSGGGRWHIVDIIARCAASTQERPITITGAFTVEPQSGLADELDAFFTYGTPFDVAEGSFDGVLDAPGGLGGPIEGARVWTLPNGTKEVGENPDLHLEVLDENDVTVAAVDIRRKERSRGSKGGMRVVFEEVNGLFTIEDRYDLQNHSATRSLKLGAFTGRPVQATYRAVLFLSMLHRSNKLRFSVRHTPQRFGLVDTNIEFKWEDDMIDVLRATAHTLKVLHTMQEHTSVPVLTPDFSSIPSSHPPAWRRAVAILEGEVITGTYPEGHCVKVVLDGEVTVAEAENLRVRLPLHVPVGEQELALGYCEVILEEPTVIDRQSTEQGILHSITTADRKIQWRLHSPTGEPEGP